MDYVREELLRQNRALEALMRAGAAEEEREAERAESVRQRTADGTGRGMRTSDFAEPSGAEHRLRGGFARELPGRRERPLWAESAAQRVEMPEETLGIGGHRQTDVREVSRAIERDARRYDGGFTMY